LEAGLSSLQATLEKLKGDEARHDQIVDNLAARLAIRRGSVKHRVAEHKVKTFHDSGYVFMKTLGQGRHGMMKLAKRKTSAQVKHTKAGPDSGKEALAQFVAVRVIQRTVVRHRGRSEADEVLASKESHSVFMRHIEALRELDHPNIQREIETFEDDTHVYIVMELYTGGDLLDMLEGEAGPLAESRVQWIMSQICAAMAHSHAKGIVHQDLRPDNVHFASKAADSRLVVTDWACLEYISVPPKECRQHLILSEYSAPELEPQHRAAGADVWSMGVMAFALLSLALPFGTHGPRAEPANFQWHVSDPKMSEMCRDFVCRMLKLDPAERMTTAQALAHPWLAEARETQAQRSGKRGSLTASVTRSLVHFKDSTVLKRTAAALAADHLTGAKLAEFTQQFQLLDKSGDGLVPTQDMVEALTHALSNSETVHELEELGEDIQKMVDNKVQIKALVTLMDTDGDGKISYSDFLAAAGEATVSTCTALCWEAFKAFDRDGNGSISRTELQDLLKNSCMDEVFERTHVVRAQTRELERAFAELGGSAQTVDEILNVADENGDQRVTFEEFMRMMATGDRPPPDPGGGKS